MPTNDLPAAAAEMLDLFQDALSTHVYSMEDGETPPIDCPMVASIQRVRNALELPAMLTPWIDPRDPATIAAQIATDAGWLIEPEDEGNEDEEVLTAWAADGSYAFGPWLTDMMPPLGAVYQWRLGSKGEGGRLFVCRDHFSMGDGTQYRIATITVQDGAALALPSAGDLPPPGIPAADTPALPSPRLGDTGPMGSVWGPAAPGVHWLNRDQQSASERGWSLYLDERGAIVIRASADGRYTGLDRHDRAADHVHAIAETPLPPYPATDARVTYRDLCQRAVAIVQATAAGRQG